MSVQPLLEERSTSRSPAGKYFEERKENIQRSKAEIESCIQTSFSSSAAFGSFTITDVSKSIVVSLLCFVFLEDRHAERVCLKSDQQTFPPGL